MNPEPLTIKTKNEPSTTKTKPEPLTIKTKKRTINNKNKTRTFNNKNKTLTINNKNKTQTFNNKNKTRTNFDSRNSLDLLSLVSLCKKRYRPERRITKKRQTEVYRFLVRDRFRKFLLIFV